MPATDEDINNFYLDQSINKPKEQSITETSDEKNPKKRKNDSRESNKQEEKENENEAEDGEDFIPIEREKEDIDSELFGESTVGSKVKKRKRLEEKQVNVIQYGIIHLFCIRVI